MSLASLLVDRLALDRAGGGLLRLLPPERAHALALALLRRVPRPGAPPTPGLARSVAGLRFANPVGIAAVLVEAGSDAGFDKDGSAFEALLDWGFGFVEVGTVTPRPQQGNPRPRLFRLPAAGAVINRMGFNNAGHEALARRLEGRSRRTGIVGVNIGCNKDAADPVADYVSGVARFAALADYLTVNLSSPNTPGLRAWQHGERLAALLDAVLSERARHRRLPVFVKLAPDLDDGELEATIEAIVARPVDGVVYANTTLARPPDLRGRHAGERGGLSGRPLAAAATARLPRLRAALRADQALIGVGGIATARDVAARLEAGADLVQLYTGLVYRGIGEGRRMLAALAA